MTHILYRRVYRIHILHLYGWYNAWLQFPSWCQLYLVSSSPTCFRDFQGTRLPEQPRSNTSSYSRSTHLQLKQTISVRLGRERGQSHAFNYQFQGTCCRLLALDDSSVTFEQFCKFDACIGIAKDTFPTSSAYPIHRDGWRITHGPGGCILRSCPPPAKAYAPGSRAADVFFFGFCISIVAAELLASKMHGIVISEDIFPAPLCMPFRRIYTKCLKGLSEESRPPGSCATLSLRQIPSWTYLRWCAYLWHCYIQTELIGHSDFKRHAVLQREIWGWSSGKGTRILQG